MPPSARVQKTPLAQRESSFFWELINTNKPELANELDWAEKRPSSIKFQADRFVHFKISYVKPKIPTQNGARIGPENHH